MTLNNLGVLHSDQNRKEEARKAFEEALAIYRELAQPNPTPTCPTWRGRSTTWGFCTATRTGWRRRARRMRRR